MDDKNKKTISIAIPIYNEEAMVDEIYSRINNTLKNIDSYLYEIVFFDDGSSDGTREAIEKLANEHDEVKAVFYARNFGYLKNTFYCMQQSKGDCAIVIHADLQNQPELIPEFIKKWENGAQVVLGVKKKSRENKIMYFLRTVFYFVMIKILGVKLVSHATEFELFDRSFIEILKTVKTNAPFLRGIIGEYASKIDYVYYTQDMRKKGKSKFNFSKYYDFAICGITHYSKVLPRRIICLSVLSMIFLSAEFLFIFLPQAADINTVELINCIILRCILFFLLVLIILACIVFEYIIFAINNSVIKPLIVEEKRIKY